MSAEANTPESQASLRRHIELEHIARLGANTRGETQYRCAEEVAMDEARSPEHRVLEVVVLEIGERMRHMLLAAGEFTLP